MTSELPDNGHALALKIANERCFRKSSDNVSGGFNQKAKVPVLPSASEGIEQATR